MSDNGLVVFGDGNVGTNKRKAAFHENVEHYPNRSSPKERRPRAILSLTKPSYTLGVGLKSVRAENRDRLCHILRKLMRQQNWAEAAGVIAVLLKATAKDSTPKLNRMKYWATMELINHLETEETKSTKIKHIYETWMRRIGSMKNLPVQARFAVQLEYILFNLCEGSLGEAHEAALCVMQEREFGSDPFANMVVGMTFYQLWYSTIPKEMQLTDLEEAYSPRQYEKPISRFNNLAESLILSDEGSYHDADPRPECSSYTSVMINKVISACADVNLGGEDSLTNNVDSQTEPPNQAVVSQGFYLASAENAECEAAAFCSDSNNLLYASILSGQEWELCLVPLRLPQPGENCEDFIMLHREMFNDHYRNAVKYLRLALFASTPRLSALHPLIQLLLMAAQIKEALDVLEKLCCNSKMELPLRLRASILEHLDHNDNIVLSTCFEDILKIDPTCRESLAKLVTMHQTGVYALESLLEMIALHLDAAYADFEIWREFAVCFFQLTQYEEDRMSVCIDKNEEEDEQRYSNCLSNIPIIFLEGESGRAWTIRGKWWLTRHFSNCTLESEIAAGNSQLLTYKAACASHIYGSKFEYVVKAYRYLEKKTDRDLLMFLKKHAHNSTGFYRLSKIN